MIAPLLSASIVIEVLIDVTAVAVALNRGSWVAVPGAVIRCVLMAALGIVAMVWRRRWAQRVFAGVEYTTAAVGFLVAFFEIPGGHFRFEPVGLGIFVVYALLGIGASIDLDEQMQQTQ